MVGGGVNSAVGRVHEIALKLDNLYSLQAGCFSRNAEINAESGRQYGLNDTQVFPSLEAMLEAKQGELDVLVITTPIAEHAEQIHLALDHGLKVISDKPLVATPKQAMEIIERVGADSTEVFSVLNYTGYPAVREMRHRIQQGQIGTPFKIMAEMPQDSYLRLKNQNKTGVIQGWRLVDGLISTLSLDLFVHIHSLVAFLTGESRATHVQSNSRSITGLANGVIDEVDALITYPNNLHVNAWYGKAALGFRNGLQIRVLGTKGSMQWLQEAPETLTMASANGDSVSVDRISSDSHITPQPRYNRFKAGHPAGFIEAFANYYADIAQAIHAEKLNEFTLPLNWVKDGLVMCEEIALSNRTHL